MTDFKIGTSGWHYDHWRGRFYPQGLAKKNWFTFYSDTFDTVELNASFYRQPRDATWDLWRDEAPPGFRFAVKANRYITHMKRFIDCEEPLKRFLGGAERLKSFLGPILYQTPPNFQRNERNVERLDRFLKILPRRHRHVFEFRHESWFSDDSLAQLRRHGVGFCAYDMPDVECPVAATAPYAYLRFHGRDEMYAANYTEKVLKRWAKRIAELAEDLDEVWIYFNNDAEAFATANAQRLRELLGA